MRAFLKSVLAIILAALGLFYIALVISAFYPEKQNHSSEGSSGDAPDYTVMILMYGIFTLFILSTLLTLINMLFLHFTYKLPIRKIYTRYVIMMAILAIGIPMGFVLFDYAGRGRFFEERTFLSFCEQYFPAFIFIALIAFFNFLLTFRKRRARVNHTNN